MKRHLEILFSPAEFATLHARDLSQTTCVVLDVLRATTSMITALANGAQAIIPVIDIPEALATKHQHPAALLAGERDGLRIPAALAQGTEFDLGNSPREFTPDRVQDRTLIMTTTNGTRALRAATGSASVLVACFRNLAAVAELLLRTPPSRLLIVCGGTYEEAALEDTLAAGALCARLWPLYADGHIADSASIALALHERWQGDLTGAMQFARNGRKLLAHATLREDVAFCLERDVIDLVPDLHPDGSVRGSHAST
ncbi:MAG: 2-phosphosulfolactate phosphatase [Verrucomicrobia bacterium]|nr:2-phosphosulfolactate phosphatase [Verrucomicrobiota bacterium]